jgi:hypothetical protein
MSHHFRTLCFSLLLFSILALGKSNTSPIAEAQSRMNQSGSNLASNPITEQVPAAQGSCTTPPGGDFVLDQVQSWSSSENWSPDRGRLAGVGLMSQGCRWIRAKAYRMIWTQANKDWILANNSGNTRRVEIIVHAFRQDSNDGCIYITTKQDAAWLSSNFAEYDIFAKSGCIYPGFSNNEGRVVITRPDLIDTTKKYAATFWWNDNNYRDLGEVPLAFGWQDLNHHDLAPDDNVKKFCFGADEGRTWGIYFRDPWDCHNASPVRLFAYTDMWGPSEGFSSRDNYLADNFIGDNVAISIRLNAGWRARLYTEANYSGQNELIDADDPDLSNNLVEDSTSSIETYTLGVAVYDAPEFGSSPHIFAGCDSNLADNPIGDNHISSVRIPPGWRLRLWDGASYTGTKVVLQGIDDTNLSNNKSMDNRASSLCADSPQTQENAGEFGDWTDE